MTDWQQGNRQLINGGINGGNEWEMMGSMMADYGEESKLCHSCLDTIRTLGVPDALRPHK